MGRRLTQEEFIERSIEIHKDKYEYNSVVFIDVTTLVTIICPIHGKFEQTPMGHLSGKGCRSCGFEISSFSGSYTREVPGIVYYIYFPTLNMWKIGVTSLSITERFSGEKVEYTVIDIINFDLIKDAYNFEYEVLSAFRNFRYVGPKLLRTGSTELLTEDIQWYLNERLKEGV